MVGNLQDIDMDSIYTEIINWAKKLPYWERYALSKLVIGEELTERDFSLMEKYILEDYGLKKRKLDRPTINFPHATKVDSDGKKRSRILSISGVKGINKLKGGQKLTFGEQLTMIF